MKRLLILFFLFSGKILFAQFSVGGSINVSFPPHTDPGIYDHTIGAVLNVGYEPTVHLKLQVNAEYILLEGKTRPFIGFTSGYAFENYELPLDFGSIHNEGLILGPTIGFLYDVGFIKNTLIEIKISYDNYYFHNNLDFIKGSVGLVYKI